MQQLRRTAFPGLCLAVALLATASSAAAAAPAPRSAVAVDSWTVTSSQSWPWAHGGGSVGRPLPLTGSASCSELRGLRAVLVDGDRVVSLTAGCRALELQLRTQRFPSPGTYTGTLAVGGGTVKLEVRRTMAVWWPILMILVGFGLAIWSQGYLDQGWRIQQRRWIAAYPRRAAEADVEYAGAAKGKPWDAYKLLGVVEEAATAAGKQLDDISRARRFPLRYLPWPEGFMGAEREALRLRLVALDKLIRDWPAMAVAFEQASAQLGEQAHYAVWAPKLCARAQAILAADSSPVDATELIARCLEASALPGSLEVIDDLASLDTYLLALEGESVIRPRLDEQTLARARQYERQASAAIREAADATLLEAAAGSLVELSSRLASRLPVPGATEDAGPGRDFGSGEPVSVRDLADMLHLPRVIARRLGQAAHSASLGISSATIMVVTLGLGVWGGLALLYNGKAWGGSWADYLVALAWGFGASSVVAPVIAAAKQLGTRPADSAPPAGA